MSRSRRGFLAACLGGAGLTLLPKALSQEGLQPPVESAEAEDRQPQGATPASTIRVETDLTPLGTRFYTQDGRRLLFVQELFLEFQPGFKQAWAGMKILLPNLSSGFPPPESPEEFYARVEPSAGARRLPRITDDRGCSLGLKAVQLTLGVLDGVDSAFLVGQVPVVVGCDLRAARVEGLHCPKCQTVNVFRQPRAVRNGWTVECGQPGGMACPVCRESGLAYEVVDPLPCLYRVMLTPETSHLLFAARPREPELRGPPADFTLDRRAAFVADPPAGASLVQFHPELDPVFAAIYGMLNPSACVR